jgi:hypothetical protein
LGFFSNKIDNLLKQAKKETGERIRSPADSFQGIGYLLIFLTWVDLGTFFFSLMTEFLVSASDFRRDRIFFFETVDVGFCSSMHHISCYSRSLCVCNNLASVSSKVLIIPLVYIQNCDSWPHNS